MTFYDRAKNAYSRGDTVRAAFVLAEGLKRTPEHAEALEWLMELYVKELRTTGIEGELIEILSTQTNGRVLYEVLENELEEAQAYQKLKALDDARRNAGTLPEPGPETPAGVSGAPSPTDVSEVLRAAERPTQADDWSSFDEEARSASSPRSDVDSSTTTPDAADQLLSEAVRETRRATAGASDVSIASDVSSTNAAITARGLSRVLPPLEDEGDDLVDDLDGGNDQVAPDVVRTPGMIIAGAVAVVLLLLAFMAAFFRGYGTSDSADDISPGEGSSIIEVR